MVATKCAGKTYKLKKNKIYKQKRTAVNKVQNRDPCSGRAQIDIEFGYLQPN